MSLVDEEAVRKRGKRDTIVMAALDHVVFDGWSRESLRRGAADAGFDVREADRLFPSGARDAVRHWVAQADRLMLEDLARVDLQSMRIRDRIATAVRTRLERWTPHREAVRRALALSLMPGFAEDGIKGCYATVDAMWRAAGDTATDYNFYTKRALLAGVYSTTMLCWLDDQSEGCEETWAFLARRIDDVMQVPKAQARMQDVIKSLPNPFRWIKTARGRPGRRAA